MGTRTFQTSYIRTTILVNGRSPSARTIDEKKQIEQTYSARLARWLDRLAHFDVKLKHTAGKDLGLIDFLSGNPVSKPEPIENKDYAFNCIIPLSEFIYNHGSINKSKMRGTRTDYSKKCEQKINQLQTSYQNKPKSSKNKSNDRSSLLLTQQKVSQVNIDSPKETKRTTKRSNDQRSNTLQQTHWL